jgi:hypothetical protein
VCTQNTVIGAVDFYGRTSAGTPMKHVGRVECKANATYGGSEWRTDLNFYTSYNAEALSSGATASFTTRRQFILNGGPVSVTLGGSTVYPIIGVLSEGGTASPNMVLQTSNSYSATRGFLLHGSSGAVLPTDTHAGEVFGSGSTGSYSYRKLAAIAFYSEGTTSASAMPGRITFWTTPASSTTLSERMRITSAGNVLIGTTSTYSVQGTAANYVLQVSGVDSSPNFIGIVQEAAAVQTRFNGLRCNNTLASKTAVANNEVLMATNGLGWDGGTTPTYVTAAVIQYVVDGTVAEDSVPGRLAFFTRAVGDTSSSLTERMRIDNAGKFYSYQMYSGYTVGGTNKAVYVDNTGMIGVLSSSIRTKQDVVDMEDIGWIDRLRPVNFCYRSSPGVKQYGLIAEEVEGVNKAMVGYDWEGLPDSVTYDRLVPVLLKAVRELRHEMAQMKLAMLP